MRFTTKVPGEDLTAASVTMDFDYERAFDRSLGDAYERLLLDCMRGDATLFARRDEIEEAWRFVTPVLEAWESDSAGDLPVYERGSAGPAEGDRLIGRGGRRWRDLP
jgi:glucose-6-phosphate 1-dehydrogenase